MGQATTNIAKVNQDVTSNILQNNVSSCSFNNDFEVNNNAVIVTGTRIKGDFTGVGGAMSSTDSTCILNSGMSSSISSILSSSLQQTINSQTDWFNGFSFGADTNTFDVSQVVTNQINQINQSTCSSNVTYSESNNYVYVSGDNVGGNFVGVNASSGQASASCNMSNTMKNIVYNKTNSSANNGNTVKGMFSGMVGSFVTMIGLVLVAVIILFAVGAIGYIGYEAATSHKGNGGGEESGGTGSTGGSLQKQEDAELALYDDLGLGDASSSNLSSLLPSQDTINSAISTFNNYAKATPA